MEAVRMRTAYLVRRGWWATVFLALVVGAAAGVAMATWSAGRSTESAFERFLDRVDSPDLNLVFCPPEMTEVDEESILACWSYDQKAELEVIQRIPEVEAAGRGAFRGLTVAPAADPERTLMTAGLFAQDETLPVTDGTPLLVSGRWYEVDSSDEVVINEFLADRADLSVGDRMTATFWSSDERGRVVPDGGNLSGPTAELQVVGIVRGIRDMAARADETNLLVDQSYVLGGPGVWRATPDATGFPGVLVAARDDDVPATSAAIEDAFGDRPFNLANYIDDNELDPVEEAIEYEANAAVALAALTALAAAVFAGQAIARQSRREWRDLLSLRAVGFSPRQAVAAAGARGLVTALLAAAVAVAVTVAASPIGAIGVASGTEQAVRLRLDLLVLAVGSAAVVAVAVLAACFPVARAGARRARSSRELVVATGPLPPTATVGVGLAVNGGRGGHGLPLGTAVASVAVAAAAAVAALGLWASMSRLTGSPERYGAPWDLSFGGEQDERAVTEASATLAASSDVAAAAGIVGTDAEIDGDTNWVMAFAPVEGVPEAIRPVIIEGREPIRSDEIALGAVTMRRLGVSIGDTVEVQSLVTGSEAYEMSVVGTAVINDTYEASPGRGAVVTPDWVVEAAPEAQTPDPYVVRLRPDAEPGALRAELEEKYAGTVATPIKQIAILNVERIAYVPVALAGVIGLLAVAALAHALLVSSRRQRGQFAVLKAIGMHRSQVMWTIVWQATVLGLVAVLAGIPLGLVIGRWGWRALAAQLGVAGGPVVPLALVALVAVVVLVTVDLVAVVPGWRAARMAPAQALRAE
jgi:ABC-type lipoprotein release transport system permease subunit